MVCFNDRNGRFNDRKIIEPSAVVAKRKSPYRSCAVFIGQYLQCVSRVVVPEERAIMLGLVSVTSPYETRGNC